jgi:hypothetical protein
MLIYIDHLPFACCFTYVEGIILLFTLGKLNSPGSTVISLH